MAAASPVVRATGCCTKARTWPARRTSSWCRSRTVAALGWIKDNVAAFGGNAANVTVFGQSGGGSKVTTLMAMPSAKGLFHRAIAMSGAQVRGAARENATRATEQYLAKVGLTSTPLDRLQQMPWRQLQEAFFAEPRIQGLAGGPVIDGTSLPRDPWSPDAPAVSADVPLMMGSVETEDAWSDPPPPLEMSEEDMLTRVRRIVRNDDGKARELVALYNIDQAAGIDGARTRPGDARTHIVSVRTDVAGSRIASADSRSATSEGLRAQRRYGFTSGFQCWMSVIGVEASSRTVLIRMRPSRAIS